MNKDIAIHWFRQDLRLSDNPALAEACRHQAVMPIYILDDENAGEYAMGAASRWWLHHSLQSLNTSLDGRLSLYAGDPLTILLSLAQRYSIRAVYWNRCYEPWRTRRDTHIKEQLSARNITVASHNGSLLWEPWNILKNDGSPYRVFTPFYRKGCLACGEPRRPLTASAARVRWHSDQNALALEHLNLLPEIRWDKKLQSHWDIGEQGALTRFRQFVETGLAHYRDGRNLPAAPWVSRISPHLHFGEISPHTLWHSVRTIADDKHTDHFCSELGWREFSYHLLYHNPELPKCNLQSKFDRFPWVTDPSALTAWQTGMTGIPMVDAGMRELWQTGYMHNRMRMITGSFLVKNLLLHWHHGERWFRDTLLDADLANNSAGWQWIAGCGADAAPFFRIFNPVMQCKKFDPQGDYVRHFVPELSALPDQYLFEPWTAPASTLIKAGVKPGVTYPEPVVDLKASRNRALQAFQSLKQS